MNAPDDPRTELASLARALRNHVARRRASGRRTVATAEQVEAARARRSAAPPPSKPVRPEPASAPAPAGAERDVELVPAPRPTATPGAREAQAERAARRDPAQPAAAVATPAEIAPTCEDLDALRAAVAACTACDLCRTRTQTVFSDGTGRARVAFVGEAPGYHEDRQGVPFVGAAGQLLSDIVTKGMGLAREDVYIANVLKCRPPENRDPTAAEKALCTPWLDRQLELLGADVVVALGRHAANHLLGTDSSMGRLRGRVHPRGAAKVVATYHPAYLLRSPDMKKECWKDIRRAMAELGLDPPGRPGR